MVICTSITKSYLEKSKPFFTSVNQNFTGRKVCFTIGLTAEIEGWETISVLPQFKWRPKNREDYYSLQHGEFIQHLQVEDEEMILFLDSDIVLQREFDLEFPATDGVLVTQFSYPALKLFEVVRNLGIRGNKERFYDKYKCFLQREFCGCFLMAKAKTWKIIFELVKQNITMLDRFEHHAAWQLLLNVVISNKLKAYVLPEHICNAEWYSGTNMKDGKVGDEVVYFNHTKFN